MPVNRDKPDRWKSDIQKSVDMYNDWFMRFAPKAFRETRVKTTIDVLETLRLTRQLTVIDVGMLREHPGILPTLRMSTCPPLAVDRLIGLAGVSRNLVGCMEAGELPPRMGKAELDSDLAKIGAAIRKMADPDIFVWLGRAKNAIDPEIRRAATIVADRLCGAVANPIIRNAQEKRQFENIAAWLKAKGYNAAPTGTRIADMKPGMFSFRTNVTVKLENGAHVNIPIDVTVMPRGAKPGDMPMLFEAKSAGDFTNVNKRRKEEGMKMAQLRRTYGDGVRFNLFLCGYFDSGYLGYEAAEGIDWIWEHRIDDFSLFGL